MLLFDVFVKETDSERCKIFLYSYFLLGVKKHQLYKNLENSCTDKTCASVTHLYSTAQRKTKHSLNPIAIWTLNTLLSTMRVLSTFSFLNNVMTLKLKTWTSKEKKYAVKYNKYALYPFCTTVNYTNCNFMSHSTVIAQQCTETLWYLKNYDCSAYLRNITFNNNTNKTNQFRSIAIMDICIIFVFSCLISTM